LVSWLRKLKKEAKLVYSEKTRSQKTEFRSQNEKKENPSVTSNAQYERKSFEF